MNQHWSMSHLQDVSSPFCGLSGYPLYQTQDGRSTQGKRIYKPKEHIEFQLRVIRYHVFTAFNIKLQHFLSQTDQCF